MTKLVGGKSTEREIRLTHTHTHQLLSQPERIRSAFVGVASRLFVSHGPLTLMFKVYFWNNNSTDSVRREVKGITCCVIFVFLLFFDFFIVWCRASKRDYCCVFIRVSCLALLFRWFINIYGIYFNGKLDFVLRTYIYCILIDKLLQ